MVSYNGTEFYCYQFDCTNTEGMNEGDTCDGDDVFTLDYDFLLDPDDFICEICGPNSTVTNPDRVVSIPLFGDYNCFDLLAAADAGNITSFECATLPFLDEVVVTPAPVETTDLVGVTPGPVETPSTPAPAPDPSSTGPRHRPRLR